MTPEIQQRMAQIQRGEVPSGYRRTKSGIIPEEWTLVSVGDCIQEYKKLSNDVLSIPVYSSSRKGLIPQSEYYNQKEAVTTNLGYKVVPQGYATYRHMSDDDIFHFNVNNTGGEILVSSEYPVFTACGNCELGFLIPSLNEMTRFRYFCRTHKLGGTRTRLYFSNLCKYRLGLPPLEEQAKIAAILSAQDKIIELKERLVTEKLRQKKYLMQQLLTGKQRLPGFQGPWKTLQIGQQDYIQIDPEYLPSNTRHDYLFTYVTLEGVNNGRLTKTLQCEYATAPSRARKMIRKADILFGMVRPNLHSHLFVDSNDGDICSTGFCVIRCNQSKVNPKLLYYHLFSKHTDKQIDSAMVGSNYPAVSANDVKRLKVTIPVSIDEQAAIADILSAVDRELDLLRRALEQEQRRKKALSQLLLTGIVRTNNAADG